MGAKLLAEEHEDVFPSVRLDHVRPSVRLDQVCPSVRLDHLSPEAEVRAAMAGGGTHVSCSVDATLPLRVSQKWVAHACRQAGVAKPRWNRHTRVWTTTGPGEGGAVETITITPGALPTTLTIEVSWLAPEGSSGHTATARRLVTSFFTGMLWALRQK